MARLIRKPANGYDEHIGPGRPSPAATFADGRHGRPRATTRLRVRCGDVAMLYLLVVAGWGIASIPLETYGFRLRSVPLLTVLCLVALVTLGMRRKRLRHLARDWKALVATLAAVTVASATTVAVFAVSAIMSGS